MNRITKGIGLFGALIVKEKIELKSGGVLQIDTGASISQQGVTAKRAVVALAGTASGVFAAWANPEAGNIWINRVIVSSQGTSGVIATAASSIDVGTTAVSATTASDNLIDGLDVHSALITSDNPGKGAGANGKTGQELASGKWITVEDDGGGSAVGFAGELIIDYTVL